MNISTLRDLSRAYALGSVDRETYRKQRHELLTRIVAGELPVLAFQPPEPEQRTVFPYEDDSGDTTQEILAPLLAQPSARTPRKSSKFLPLAALAMALLVGGWALREYLSSEPPASPLPVVLDSVEPAQDLFAQFLSANQWQNTHLAALSARWESLDDAAREQLRYAPSMRRMIDKTLEQIQAERALMALGDADDALDNQQQLLDLMSHLGAQDVRLTRAREALQAAHNEHQQKRAAAPDDKTSVPDITALAPAPESAAVAALEPPSAVVPADVSPAPLDLPAPTTTTASPAANTAPITPSPASATSKSTRAPKNARTACDAALAKTRRPYCQDTLGALGKGPALVLLPAGEFVMGGLGLEERPQHTVRLEHAFAIGLFEVSVAEFAQFCAATRIACPPQPWSDPTLPIVNVSWAIAEAYTRWLSKISGENYRLPSEAEWEYAARAGSTTPYPFGAKILPTHARYSFKNPVSTPLPARDRSVNRNNFKLYHMLGNVREWVLDGWRANYDDARADGRAQSAGNGRQVARGGSYADSGAALRSAARLPLDAAGDQFTGLRVVREIK